MHGPRWLVGSLLGLFGTLSLLFWPVLADAQLGANGWKAHACCLPAAYEPVCTSPLGSLVSAPSPGASALGLSGALQMGALGHGVRCGAAAGLGHGTRPVPHPCPRIAKRLPRVHGLSGHLPAPSSPSPPTSPWWDASAPSTLTALPPPSLFPWVALTLSTFYDGASSGRRSPSSAWW